jgi:eukaryotic-like serine/threonine-protein kinase
MSDVDTGKEIAGRYRILRLIGRGGMGAVYEVEHLHTGQHLAMKILSAQRHGEDAVERFKREARAASRIQSDHVVRVTDADVAPELDGAPFLVMELLDGADLERVAAGGAAERADVVEWLRQVARAVAKAHDAGIVHRDLKPENLFLTRREDGRPLVKILDFGIAKMTADAGPLTHSGQFLGTPHYMAPEQADPHGTPVTARADLFSIGLIAFRLLTGHGYWKTGSLAQLLAQILTEPITAPSTRGSSLGPEFDLWFLRSCDRDPDKRFASAIEQMEALARALGVPHEERADTPATTTPAGGPTLQSAASTPRTIEAAATLAASSTELGGSRTRRTGARRVWLAIGASGVGVALGIGVFVRGSTPSRPTTAPATLSTPDVDPRAAAPAVMAPAPPVDRGALPGVVPVADAGATTASSTAGPPLRPRLGPPPAPSRRTEPSAHKDPLEGQY